MLQKFLLVMAVLIGAILVLIPSVFTFVVGMTIVFLGVAFYAFKVENVSVRVRWFFVTLFVLLAGIVASITLANSQIGVGYSDYVTELMMRGWALFVGVSVSLIVTLIFFLLVVYTSSVYVLALQTEEGLTVGQAFRSLLSLILGAQYDWIVVSDGKVTTTKEKGVMQKMGGPGKIIIAPGNAVVLEKAGKISRICGAGIVITTRFERIRQIFDLRPQFNIVSVENVVTANQIPLTIELGVGYRLKPASNPNTPGVIKDNMDAFPVEEETLRRAAFNHTAGQWTGFGQGVVISNLRDQIMAHTLEELFELVPGSSGTPTVNRRRVQIIEETIQKEINEFAGNLGVLITGVDIRQIMLPGQVEESIYKGLELQIEAEAIAKRNEARGNLMNTFLDSIAQRTEKVGETELQVATTLFAQVMQRALTDEVSRYQYLDRLRSLVALGDPTYMTRPGVSSKSESSAGSQD
jgi:regulator of protease activity HflC (stomatin/prohibitin superfamily)